MYLYASEHALMDYHLNEEKQKKAQQEAEVKPQVQATTETNQTK